jgi:Mismatch repair ATPase (MutS family)
MVLLLGENNEEYMDLMGENERIEIQVREILSGKLREKREELEIGLRNLALLDILTAKIDQIKEMGLCLPVVVDEGETFYCEMFNPFVLDCLRKDGKEFQKVDISFRKEPITIIGANMGGKSVVLKTSGVESVTSTIWVWSGGKKLLCLCCR